MWRGEKALTIEGREISGVMEAEEITHGKVMLKYTIALITSGAIALGTSFIIGAMADAKLSEAKSAETKVGDTNLADTKLGAANPFYAASTLPFHAPPFDKIKDADYQPAIEAGMDQELAEVQAIADNPAPPTFENTLVAMEKTGRLLQRALLTFVAVSGANTNDVLLESTGGRSAQVGSAPGRHLPERKTFCAGGCGLRAARRAEARSGIAETAAR